MNNKDSADTDSSIDIGTDAHRGVSIIISKVTHKTVWMFCDYILIALYLLNR